MTARYREVADELRARLGGEFAVGQRLPAISTLQHEYAVAGLNTIRSALKVLAQEGLIRTEPGRGSFVTAVPAPRSPGDDSPAEPVSLADLPDEAREILKARAAERGEPLSVYLIDVLSRHAAEPTTAEVLARAAGRAERAPRSSLRAVEAARAERSR